MPFFSSVRALFVGIKLFALISILQAGKPLHTRSQTLLHDEVDEGINRK
jgi:hypothetical protein